MAGRQGRVRVYYDGDTTGLRRSTQQAEQSIRGMSTRSSKHIQELDRHSRSLGTSLRGAAKAAAGAAAAYIGISQAKEAVTATTDLAKVTLSLHHNLGLSVKTASEFGAQLKVRGADAKQASQAFATFAGVLHSAAEGSASARDRLAELGISGKKLKQDLADPQKAIFDVSDGIKNLGEGMKRTDDQRKLFGRGWQALSPLLRGGSADLKQQLDLANQMGASFGGKNLKSVQDLISEQRKMQLAMLGLQISFTENVEPSLLKMFQLFGKVTNAVRKMSPVVKDALAIAAVGAGTLLFLGKLAKAWNAIRDAAGLAGAAQKVASSGGGVGLPGRGRTPTTVPGGGARTAEKAAHLAPLAAEFGGPAGIATGGVIGAVVLAREVSHLTHTEEQLSIAQHAVGRSISVVNGDFERHKRMLEGVVGSYKKFEDVATSKLGRVAGVTQADMEKVRTAMDKGPAAGQQALANHFQKMVANIQAAMDKGTVSVKKGTDYINTILKQEFTTLGIPNLFMTQQQASAQHKTTIAHQKQRGGMLPGPSAGDKIPLMAEGGEFMMNAKATARFLPLLEALNRAVPRFAGGGQIPTWTGKGAFGAMAAGALDMESAAAQRYLSKHSAAGYHFPFEHSSGLSWGRTDMGVDFTGTGPISAIGNAHINRIGAPGWPGGGGVNYTLTSGPRRGSTIYTYEGVDAKVGAGQNVRAGQTIANFRPGGSIEVGWGLPSGAAMAASHYSEGQVTSEGSSMRKFLSKLSHKQLGGIVGYQSGGVVGDPKHGAHWIHPGNKSHWSVDEAATLLWQVGATESEAAQIARVIPGESGGDPHATNSSSKAAGLFQILGRVDGGRGNIYDPRINAWNAVLKYRGAGHSLSPWTAGATAGPGHILRSRVGSDRSQSSSSGSSSTPAASVADVLASNLTTKGGGIKGSSKLAQGLLASGLGASGAPPSAGDAGTAADDLQQQIAQLLQEIRDLQAQQTDAQVRATNLLNSQSGPNGAIANALAAVVSGSIGGQVGLGFASPSFAGGLASY